MCPNDHRPIYSESSNQKTSVKVGLRRTVLEIYVSHLKLQSPLNLGWNIDLSIAFEAPYKSNEALSSKSQLYGYSTVMATNLGPSRSLKR